MVRMKSDFLSSSVSRVIRPLMMLCCLLYVSFTPKLTVDFKLLNSKQTVITGSHGKIPKELVYLFDVIVNRCARITNLTSVTQRFAL